MMDPMLDEFTEFISQFKLQPPAIPLVSSATGTWMTAAEAADPRYWARQLRQTIRFDDALSELLKDTNSVFLEIGPGDTLTALATNHVHRTSSQQTIVSMPSARDRTSDASEFLLRALGRLWVAGAEIDWRGFHRHEQRRRLPLPSYPFERQRYWIEPVRQQYSTLPTSAGPTEEPKPGGFYVPVWRQVNLSIEHQADAERPWLVFQDAVGVGRQIAESLRVRGVPCMTVSPGPNYARLTDRDFQIDPEDPQNYTRLLAELNSGGALPTTCVHLWSIFTTAISGEPADYLPRIKALSFYSLLYLVQALGTESITREVRIGIISNNLQQVAREPVLAPERALLLGPCRVAPKEFRNLRCRTVDIELPSALTANGRMPDALRELAGQIIAELRGPASDSVVAYRGNERWVRTFEVMSHNGNRNSVEFRERGIYMITGGLGGIGLVLAHWLARTVRARLVLVGRHPLPARDSWDVELKQRSKDDVLFRRLKKLREIEAAGGEVLAVAADVTDQESLRAVLEQARNRFGPIHGVIHAAGVLDDAPILQKDRRSVDRVLAPKLEGTLVLDSLFAAEPQPLDFFVLMSSVSALLAPPGQVDYAAGNAFLDSFAQTKSNVSRHVVSIEWPRWLDVGMAADSAANQSDGRLHPLLHRRLSTSGDTTVYSTTLSTEHDWIINEHQLKVGAGLFPGTGYLEMIRAALGSTSSLIIHNLQFEAPLRVEATSSREIRLELRKQGTDRYAFSIAAKTDENEEGGIQCASGEAAVTAATQISRQKLRTIRRHCNQRELTFTHGQNEKQERYITFGPRWRALRRIYLGRAEALSLVELPVEFASDLESYHVHPAVLDMATGASMFLIPGYESSDQLYVPIRYGRITLLNRLPAKYYSHIQLSPEVTPNSPIATFDITLLDEDGNILALIEQFSITQFRDQLISGEPVRVMAPRALRSGAFSSNLLGGRSESEAVDGISSVEGVEGFKRIFDDGCPNNVVIYSADLLAALETSQFVAPLAQSRSTATADNGGLDEVQATLVEWWRALLGVDSVSVQDDFFALGGQSLSALRLFAKIKNRYGLELSLSTLYQAPTIEKLASLVRKQESAPDSSIVPIRPNGSRPPLFLIHGLWGNLNFYSELIQRLAPDQPIYGVQAQILGDGKVPLMRLEDLAWSYLKDIRRTQPQGPYYFLGYSFGGVLAFEMAQQLHASGESVALLGMLDTREWGVLRDFRANENYSRKLARLIRKFGDEGLRIVKGPSRFSYLSSVLVDRWQYHLRPELIGSAYKILMRARWPLPKFLVNDYDVNEFAVAQYRPAFYPGDITIFRAEEGLASRDVRFGPDLGWRRFAGGGVEVREIPGDHNDLMKPPNVGVLAREVTSCLARRQAEASRLAYPRTDEFLQRLEVPRLRSQQPLPNEGPNEKETLVAVR
jgi:acyl transferase domain-containing protein/thioesterase domain-containing protein